MKAIILAAGKGVRMGKYTRNLPKGMLEFDGKTLLQWQMESLRAGGVNRIVVVTGYQSEKIPYSDVTYYHNPDFASTNMVESLMCARSELTEDILVSYADIIYTPALVRQLIASKDPITVAVDSAWRAYWEMRYGSCETDLETLTVNDGYITDLGIETESSEGIDYRYIGLVGFSAAIWSDVLDLYDTKRSSGDAWRQSGKDLRNGYMTDLLHELIQRGVPVAPAVSQRQWLEFDTETDYEVTTAKLASGDLGDYLDPI